MDIEFDDIFSLHSKQNLPVPGALLVAKPLIIDPFFGRSVVIIVEHDIDRGSRGFITNQPAPYTLPQLVPEVDDAHDIPVFFGGPVALDRLSWIHNLGPDIIPESTMLRQGLYYGGDFAAVCRYVNAGRPTEGRIKFLMGQSSWSQGQLAGEIGMHDWAVLYQFDNSTILATATEQMWQKVVAGMGHESALWNNWPTDLSSN